MANFAHFGHPLPKGRRPPPPPLRRVPAKKEGARQKDQRVTQNFRRARPTNASPAGITHGLKETRGEPIELPTNGANAGQGYDIGGGGSPSGGNRRSPPTIIFYK